MALELSEADLAALIVHAREDAPAECCGLLVGTDSRVTEVRRMVNVEHSPYVYRIDPLELLRILPELDNSGLCLVAIYHSHTHTAAYPSPTDVRYAQAYPDAVQVIVSLEDPRRPVVRAFRIDGEAIVEEGLEIAA